MKKKVLLFTAALVVILSVLLCGCASKTVGTKDVNKETNGSASQETGISITIKITNNQIEPKAETKETVNTACKTLGEFVQSSDKFEWEDGEYGTVIRGVSGAKEDAAKGLYWMFKVNGEDSMVGADEVALEDGGEYEFYVISY